MSRAKNEMAFQALRKVYLAKTAPRFMLASEARLQFLASERIYTSCTKLYTGYSFSEGW